jgi:succinate-semialdehyde dehydrogenase / glutarate-semialdehyde dehydrogenase
MPLTGHPLLRTRCFVDGAWIDGERSFAVDDPATGDVLARVPELDVAAVDGAIDAAARAFPGWRDALAAERAACLAKLADAMLLQERALGAMITAENGKPHAEAIAEVRYAASFLSWFSGEATRIQGETIATPRRDQRATISREPVGPCALITPWNFPAAMLTRKLGAALAAGCTVVAKPAQQTPLTALALAQLAADAGVPAGVVNVVTGDAAVVGGRLTAHPAIRKVSFTGSTRVGQLIQRAAADDLKRVTLELGGNAPFIVFEDADLPRMVKGAMVAKFRCGGQTCVAANRFLLAAPIEAAATEALVAACQAIRIGPGMEPGVDIGPLIDDAAVGKVRKLVSDALDRGARLLLGAVPDGKTRFVAPVVLAGVTREMALWREEIFGPVVALRTFTDEADAIAQGNDTDAGLVAYVWTRDLARADRVVRALEVGMAGINEGLVSYAHAPFGGVKHSGYGREGGHAGLDDYLQLKYVMSAV